MTVDLTDVHSGLLQTLQLVQPLLLLILPTLSQHLLLLLQHLLHFSRSHLLADESENGVEEVETGLEVVIVHLVQEVQCPDLVLHDPGFLQQESPLLASVALLEYLLHLGQVVRQ